MHSFVVQLSPCLCRLAEVADTANSITHSCGDCHKAVTELAFRSEGFPFRGVILDRECVFRGFSFTRSGVLLLSCFFLLERPLLPTNLPSSSLPFQSTHAIHNIINIHHTYKRYSLKLSQPLQLLGMARTGYPGHHPRRGAPLNLSMVLPRSAILPAPYTGTWREGQQPKFVIPDKVCLLLVSMLL